MKNTIIRATIFFVWLYLGFSVSFAGHTRAVSELIAPTMSETTVVAADPYQELRAWQQVNRPFRVGLQVGHWKNEELPHEHARLIGNTGASSPEGTELESNLAIVERTTRLLEAQGVVVDVLPATVPSRYQADVFITVHADGSLDQTKSGFKIAGPWRDTTGLSDELVGHLTTAYAGATGFAQDPMITENMTDYYAFGWWRFEHAIHPDTVAAIVETGFISSAADRNVILHQPEVPAQAIADGILSYLSERVLQP